MKKVKIAIFGALSDSKFKSKVEPLVDLDQVSKVYLFRSCSNPLNKLYSTKIIYTRKIFSKYTFYIYTFFSLISLSLRNKINFLIAFYFLPFGLIVGIVGLITGKPYILIFPGSDLKWLIKRKMFFFILRRSYKIGVRGNNSFSKLVELGIDAENIFVLHNSFILPKMEVEKTINKKWDIIYIGYFRKPKRLDISIEVIEKLKKEFPLIKSVFVGNGPDYQRINEMIKEKRLENNIFLTGHKNEINSYLEQSKIFLLTSGSEGLPMVLIEAMSHGIPVVTSDVNDISDVVIHKKNGYLVKSLDCDDYVTSILELLNDKKRYTEFSSNARNSMEDFYKNLSSFNSIQKKWLEVIFGI